jgi:hypothetical protein
VWEREPGTVEAAWRAAVAVTARAYKLSDRVLGAAAPSGRCKRTPPGYWLPRKVAIYVAVLICDCTYAALARAIGMHRDTVTSQMDEVRELVDADRVLARLVETLERDAGARLVGALDSRLAAHQADRDHVQSLRRDRLATAAPEPPRNVRGRIAAIRQKRGGFQSGHENFIRPALEAAE